MLSKIRKKKLESNIWKFYLYRVFSTLVFVSPIFVLFLQENKLSMIQIMLIQSIFTTVVMLSVVPSGIIADYFGRKNVLIVSTILHIAGWFLYAFGHNFLDFAIAETVFGISAAAWMASGSAFFYDSLRELGKEESYKRLFGNTVGIEHIVSAFAALAGGYIATYFNSFRLPFLVSGLVVLFSLAIVLSFTATKNYKHGDKHYFLHLKNATKFAATHPRIRLFIIYSAISLAILFTAYIFYQPYLQSIKISLVYFGWIYFAMSLLAAAGAKIADKAESYLGERKILILMLIFFLISIYGMSLELKIIGFIFPILIFFVGGVFQPVISDYINKHTESEHRATVLALNELVVEFFAALSAPLFGWVADLWSLAAAFEFMAVILIINLFILISVFTIIRRRER
ncbi:MFS transporter [Candidatus Woesearchaeota archaeon]|nr:MFS transporter [Candidatus Woesearchaeota archaeon]